MVNIKDWLYIVNLFNEATDDKLNDHHLDVYMVDPDDFIKKNPSTKEITSSIFFTRFGQPDPDGLLSNEIFGLTKEERSGIYGYINLNDYFLQPLVYKKLYRLDRKFKDIVFGTKRYIINSSGELIEDDEKGKTGLKWLKSNFDSIKLKANGSDARKKHINWIKKNRKVLFINKLLVLPAYYRDVNTESSGMVSVGEINELYANIISNVRGIKDTQDFGIDVSDSIRGRIQEGILAVYDWICGNANSLLEGSTGLSKKNGIIRRAGLSKTTDFGARLVISAPDLKVETLDDMLVDCQHAAVPLASLLANFLPFIIFQVKRWIDNELTGDIAAYNTKTGKVEYITVDDIQMQFTEDVIKDQIDNFIHGYSDRLAPFTFKWNGRDINLKFQGTYATDKDNEQGIKTGTNIVDKQNLTTGDIDRVITWCDIFYMAAVEATRDKCVLITRYPIDSMYNQFPSQIIVASTNETEPMYYKGTFYKYYPKIRPEDIGSNTSNTFVDTLRVSNLMLKIILGDYDGDQVSVKGVFTKEANEECIKYINSKLNYIGMDGKTIRITQNEAVQAIYTLTLTMSSDQSKLKDPVF